MDQKENPVREEQKGQTHSDKPEIILLTALRLFTAQGYHATPTSQISREAGISTGTLFHYFPDKNSLVDQLYLSIKKEISQIIKSSDDPSLPPEQRLERCFTEFVFWGVDNPEKIRFLEQFYHSPTIGEEVMNEVHQEFAWLLEVADAAMHEETLLTRPLEFYSVMFTQILFGVLRLIRTGTTHLSTEELIQYGLEMLRR